MSSLLRLYAYRTAFTAMSLRSFLHFRLLTDLMPMRRKPRSPELPQQSLAPDCMGSSTHPELTTVFHWKHAFGKTVFFLL